MAQSADIYVAKESFATTVDGAPVVINKGITRVRKGHPLLKGHADFFEPLTIHYDVEQATSAPSERRGAPASASTLTRPAPRTAPAAPSATETPEETATEPTDAPASPTT